jgi:GMP synthase-like glutamine amidotransferase
MSEPIIKKIKCPIKVFVLSKHQGDALWLNEGNVTFVDTIDECDVLILPGGADIDPKYYKHQKSTLTRVGSEQQDEYEKSAFEEAVGKNKFIIGICKGAQWCNVLSGGIMIQHVNHHATGKYHLIKDTDTGVTVAVNSLHHQMMFPYYLPKDEYKIIAYSKKNYFQMDFLSHFSYIGQDDKQFTPLGASLSLKEDPAFMEPEIVWFPKTKSFAVQCHPEMMDSVSTGVNYINRKLIPLLFLHLQNKLELTSRHTP